MRLEKPLKWALHQYWRFSRPVTLGVRAIVTDDRDRIFLVKHTYVRGWHLPGGGVERGETVAQAVKKELGEEANIEVRSEPVLLGLLKNELASKRDHVALFHVSQFRQESLPAPNREIRQSGWFAHQALPEGTTPATRRRIQEFFEGNRPPPYW